MADADWRALLSRSRAEPGDDVLLERTLRALRRAEVEIPRDLLCRSERWRRVAGVVRKWYARPLSAEDGNSPAEVAEAETRLGGPLPEALREWYLLAGRRPGLLSLPMSSHEVPLSALAATDGTIDVYRTRLETEGYSLPWSWAVPEGDATPDPSVLKLVSVPFESDTVPWEHEIPCLSVLFLCLVLDGVVKRRCGSLDDPLHQSVHGGLVDWGPGVAELGDAYPQLPLPAWEDGWFRGDADTIVFIRDVGEGGRFATAAARTPAAGKCLDDLARRWSLSWGKRAPVRAGHERLHRAIVRGRLADVRSALEAGANFGTLVPPERGGGTPLHLAIREARPRRVGLDVAIVEALIRIGVELEARDRDEWTALQLATWEGPEAIALRLLEANADPNASSLSPIDVLSGKSNQRDVVRGLRALDMAVIRSRGSTRLLKALLEAGSRVGGHSDSGWTALHWAAAYGSADAARVLLDHGADGDAPAHQAVQRYVLDPDSLDPFDTYCQLLFPAGVTPIRVAELAENTSVLEVLQS